MRDLYFVEQSANLWLTSISDTIMIALASDMWTPIVGQIMACSCFGKTILKGTI